MKTKKYRRNQLWSQHPLPEGMLVDVEVHVWRFGLNVSDLALRRFREMLCETEIVRADGFRFPDLRRRFVAARGALRSILAGYLSIDPLQLAFSYGPHGKPTVRNSLEGFQFNLSHSDDLMVAAVCRRGFIGVDIEREKPEFPVREIAGRYFCEKERDAIARADDKTGLRAFFQLWTAKEAVTKATALGLSLELSKVEIGLDPLRVLTLDEPAGPAAPKWRLYSFCPGENFQGTLAVTMEPVHLEYRSLSLE